MNVLAIFLLLLPLAWAEREVEITKCSECVNYNCPEDTRTTKGFCFRLYLSNYCHPDCAGTNWSAQGVTCQGDPIPKPYFIGTKPATCTSTATQTMTKLRNTSATATATQSSTETSLEIVEVSEQTPEKSILISAATKKAAQIEMETAKQAAAQLKETVSQIKNENQQSADFYRGKKQDLELGKSLAEVLPSTFAGSGVLGKSGAQEKFSSGKQKGLSGTTSNATATATEGTSEPSAARITETAVEAKTPSKSGSSPVDKIKALELLRERLKKLLAENTIGAKTEALEIQKLMELIENGKIPQVEEAKMLQYLNSKPEFHLDENETRSAIRELIGDLEESQLPTTDLFTRVKDYYRDALRAGKIKQRR
jgi:hypothetical protein